MSTITTTPAFAPHATPTRPGGDLVSRIESIQVASRHLTGRGISWQDAARLLERYGDVLVPVGGDFDPVAPWAAEIMCLLVTERYSDHSIRQVVAHVMQWRSVWRLPESLLDGEDRETIEAIIATAK